MDGLVELNYWIDWTCMAGGYERDCLLFRVFSCREQLTASDYILTSYYTYTIYNYNNIATKQNQSPSPQHLNLILKLPNKASQPKTVPFSITPFYRNLSIFHSNKLSFNTNRFNGFMFFRRLTIFMLFLFPCNIINYCER